MPGSFEVQTIHTVSKDRQQACFSYIHSKEMINFKFVTACCYNPYARGQLHIQKQSGGGGNGLGFGGGTRV